MEKKGIGIIAKTIFYKMSVFGNGMILRQIWIQQ